jgi:hypothetical protein
MNWCHMCGKWCDLGSSSYFCSACIDDWSATFAAQQEEKDSVDERNDSQPLPVASGPGPLEIEVGEGENKEPSASTQARG